MLNRSGTLGVILLIAILAAGCSRTETSEPASVSQQPSLVTASVPPIQTVDTVQHEPSPAGNSTEIGPTRTPHPDKSTQSLGNDKPAGNKAAPATGEFRSYSSEAPALAGVLLGEPRLKVEARLGKPNETYAMEGEDETLAVADYSSFTIGYSTQGTVVFIDVSSSEVNTGLNGLKLGQKGEDAEKALGKADSSSTYVLTYLTKSSVLKLDLDPKTKAILSIKLFVRES